MDQSQSESQRYDPMSTTFDIEKFSWAQDAGSSKPHWTHDTRSTGLFLTFRKFRTTSHSQLDAKVLMEVYAESNLLEQVDIQRLSSLVTAFDNVERGLGKIPMDSPVQILYQPPYVIAIRYYMTSEPGLPVQVRRIQIRFKTNEDFRKALDIFIQLKFRVTEAIKKAPPALASGQFHEAFNKLASTASHHISLPPRPFSALSTSSSSIISGPGSTKSFSSSFMMTPELDAVGRRRPPSSAPLTIAAPHEDTTSMSPHPMSSSTLKVSSSQLGDAGSPVMRSGTSNSFESYRGIAPQNVRTAIHENQVSGSTLKRQDFNILASENSTNIAPQDLRLPFSCSMRGDLSRLRRQATEFTLKHPGSNDSLHLDQPFNMHSNGSQARRLATAMHPSEMRDYEMDRRQSFPGGSQLFGFASVDHEIVSGLYMPPKRDLPFPKAREVPRSISESQLRNEAPLVSSSNFKMSTQSNSSLILNSSRAAPPAVPEPPKPITPTAQTAPCYKPKRTTVAKRAPAKSLFSPPLVEKSSEDQQARAEDLEKADTLTVAPPRARFSVDEPSPLAAKAAAVKRPSTAPGLLSKAVPAKRKAPVAPRQRAAAAKKQKMVDSSTQTTTQAGREHTSLVAVMPPVEMLIAPTVTGVSDGLVAQSPAVVPPTEQSPSPIVTGVAGISFIELSPVVPANSTTIQKVAATPPVSYLDMIDAIVSASRDRSAPIELWQRPEWHNGSEEERRTLLNDFIAQCLTDTSFLQFCEDVDNSWRRTGTGI